MGSIGASDCRVLIVPGLGGSGPRHWQTLWEEAHPQYRRVVQQDWNNPDLNDWAEAVDRTVLESSVPCVLVAHSFGCLAVLRRVVRSAEGIAGVLLVAPADPDRWGVAASALPDGPFGLPSVFVASETDPWLHISKAHALARRWDSPFVNLGDVGHINVDSGFGPWPKGEGLLHELCIMIDRHLPAIAV
jgi:hypothetical protein